MTDKELVKKAVEYRIKLVPYTQLGYPDVEIPVYSALQIAEAHIAGAKELQEENQQLKQRIEKMVCCGNCKKYKMLESQVPLSCLSNRKTYSCCEDWEIIE